MEKRIGCVVMAAGNAARFGENKLAAELRGRTFIGRALDAVPTEELAAVAVVTQYPAVEALARARGFAAVRNDRPELGLSRTVRLGTEALADCDAILYLVSDQPLLTRETVKRVLAQWREAPDCIAAASHGGKRGNPCIFPKEFFPELTALEGDRGGSAVICAHPERLALVEAEKEELTDVDTKAALDELKEKIGD